MAVANQSRGGLWDRILRRLGLRRERDLRGRPRKSTWMQTYRGVQFWPLDPRADEVTYDDVVIGLARECRYGNHCREFYSVAEHCVIVSIYAEKLARERRWSPSSVLWAARYGLLHDASEAYLGDMIRPVKHQPEMRQFRRAEDGVQAVVFEHFGVPEHPAVHALVKEVDNAALVDEMEALMLHPELYLRGHEQVSGLGAEIAAMPWEQAVHAFSQRFQELFPDYVELDTALGVVLS